MWRTNVTLAIIITVALLALCVSAKASDPNLVAHWMLDEGTGSIAYDSAGGNDGILNGDPNWTAGQVDGALELDGVDDYVDLGNGANLKPPLPVTLCTWVNSSGSGKWQRIISIDEQSSKYYGIWLQIDLTDKLHVGFGDGAGTDSQKYRRSKVSTTVLNPGTWYHVVGVVRGPTDMDLYINGVDDGGTYTGSGGPLVYSDGASSLCREDRSRFYFGGIIDDVRIYDKALSAEEVELLYYWTGFTPSELAIMALEDAILEKLQALQSIDAALEKEWEAYDDLQELLASGEYGDLTKQDIAAAQRKIDSAIRRQERSKRVVLGSIEELEDALLSLGWEPAPEPNEPPEPNVPEPNIPTPVKLLKTSPRRR
jgi:hypothetical protein